jgi:hypothetical protein
LSRIPRSMRMLHGISACRFDKPRIEPFNP